MKIHKEGCEGDVCTCDAVDNVLPFEKKVEEYEAEYATPYNVLMDMVEEDLDTVMVIGYKGDDLIVSGLGSSKTGVDPKMLLKRAGELLSKL